MKSDFTSALVCLCSKDFVPPWPFQAQWLTCSNRIHEMTFWCSHIYPEGNVVTEKFSNMVFCSSNVCFSWLDLQTPCSFICFFFIFFKEG